MADGQLFDALGNAKRLWEKSRGDQRLLAPSRCHSADSIGAEGLHPVTQARNTTNSSPGENMSSPTVVALSRRRGRESKIVADYTPKYHRPSPTSQTALPSATIVRGASESLTPASRIELGHAPPVVQGIPLVSVNELPDRLRPLFPFPLFNAVQSKCFNTAFRAEHNLVLSAPTGSGKTVVMELAICNLKLSARNEQFKIVYQAPTKALCRERCTEWQAKFSSLDLQCAELTGDTDANQMRNVQAAQIIITTPEKWDSITRRWKDHVKLMHLIKLFLIDEVHILKESRGATLEAVVSRMKSTVSSVRFIALSATIPNAEDVAQWLGRDSRSPTIAAAQEAFGEEFRPVQLQKAVYGFPIKSNDFAFDSMLESKLPEIIARHSQRKPILIFCPFRKSCVKTAKSLAQLWTSTVPAERLWAGPSHAPGILDNDLRQLVSAGIAFHHAGLDLADRCAVEQAFLIHKVHIICCTSTLAVGVNLPCYLAIIKGTVAWTENGRQEYADLEMMQMLGRAGRPQFEQAACAVILTRQDRVEYYNSLVSGKEPLESCLHLNLIDHLNAEIGLGTVSDLTLAKRWLASTFLFVRLSRNPNHYRLKEDVTSGRDDKFLAHICARDVASLQEVDLVTREGKLSCTEFGDAMARYYVKFDTMKILLSLPPKAKLSEILSAFAQAAEFRDWRLKSGEKSLYKHINKDVGIKFPIKVDLALPAHKVSLLIQAELGGVDFPAGEQFAKHKTQFQQDKTMVFQHANRLARCIIDCQLSRGDAVSARHALELARCFAARVWENSPLQLKQLDQIGNVAVRKLANTGINSIESLENTEAQRLESVIGRGPPFGMKLLSQLAQFPKLWVSVKLVGKEVRLRSHVKVMLRSEIGFLNEKVPVFFRKRPVYVCFLAEASDGKIIDFRRISATKLTNGHEVLWSVELTKPSQYVSCHAMCDEIAATCKSAELRPHFPVSLFPNAANGRDREQNEKMSSHEWENHQSQNMERKRRYSETFEESGLDDGDLLAAERIEVIDLDACDNELAPLSRRKSALSDRGTGNLHYQCAVEGDVEPAKLRNGKYACNHKCKEKGKCRHLCCKEGLERPPKPPKKAISSNADDHATSSSMLDAINKNSCQRTITRAVPSRGGPKGSQSSGVAQTQQQPRSVAKEAKGMSMVHQATTGSMSSCALQLGTSSQGGQENKFSGASPASSKRLPNEGNVDEDIFGLDWVNAVDSEDGDLPENLEDLSQARHETTKAVGVEEVDHDHDVFDLGSEMDLGDKDEVRLGSDTVGWEQSMGSENWVLDAKRKKIGSNSQESLSSQTVCESSSCGVEIVHTKDPFRTDVGIYESDQRGLRAEDVEPDSLGFKGEDRSCTEPFARGSTVSPTRKLFFTSPERGPIGVSDAAATAGTELSPGSQTSVGASTSKAKVLSQKSPSTKTTAATAKVMVPGNAALDPPSRQGSRWKSGHEATAEAEGHHGFVLTHEISEGQEDQEDQKLQPPMDDIDPTLYDEFKDFVDFV